MVSKMQRAFEEKAFGKPVIVPRFFEHARIDKARTTGYGMKIYNNSTYVEIKTSGRRDTTTRLATDDDKELFKHSYDIYVEQNSASIPMEALAGFSIANLYILRDLDIFTVEELAEYEGTLPLASLKLMQHCAGFLVQQMQMYQPPSFHDDALEVPRETHQAQRQILSGGEGIKITDSDHRNNGSGVQQFGVTLDEKGEIIEVLGQAYTEEGQQKENHQKAVNFY